MRCAAPNQHYRLGLKTSAPLIMRTRDTSWMTFTATSWPLYLPRYTRPYLRALQTRR